MEFLQAVLKRDYFFFVVCFDTLNRRMSHYLIRSGVVFLFHHVGMPLDSNVAFLEEVLDRNQGRLDQAATALLDPVTLAAGVALTIDHL